MGGTDNNDHKLALYRTSIKSRKWPHKVIFHFFANTVINAHILYRLKNRLENGDYLYKVGDFIEEAANQMKAKGFAATRTVATADAAAVPATVTKIANPSSHSSTWEACPSRLNGRHFPIQFRRDNADLPRRRCKMPGCGREIRCYCTTCEVPLCIDDMDGTSCFEKFHTIKRLGPPGGL